MIVKEVIKINDKEFNHVFSDSNLKIERDGIIYNDAIDPLEFSDRVYTETNIPIIEENETLNEPNLDEEENGDYLELPPLI